MLTYDATRLSGFASADISYAHDDISNGFSEFSNKVEFVNIRTSTGADTVNVNVCGTAWVVAPQSLCDTLWDRTHPEPSVIDRIFVQYFELDEQGQATSDVSGHSTIRLPRDGQVHEMISEA